nr:MAG TPA: hypothetical protein [Caudoviricetes sp.]
MYGRKGEQETIGRNDRSQQAGKTICWLSFCRNSGSGVQG